MAAFAVISALGFGLLFAEIGGYFAGPPTGYLLGGLSALCYLTAFLLPRLLIRYTIEESAPVVLHRVTLRFLLAVGVTLLPSIVSFIILVPGSHRPVAPSMEISAITLMAVVLFHALGGLFADHANYLQQTHQYNSNQLLAILMLITVLFFTLALYLLTFDLVIPREPRIFLRDGLFGILALMGFGYFIYRLAHH